MSRLTGVLWMIASLAGAGAGVALGSLLSRALT
jgi:hypothetical protein